MLEVDLCSQVQSLTKWASNFRILSFSLKTANQFRHKTQVKAKKTAFAPRKFHMKMKVASEKIELRFWGLVMQKIVPDYVRKLYVPCECHRIDRKISLQWCWWARISWRLVGKFWNFLHFVKAWKIFRLWGKSHAHQHMKWISILEAYLTRGIIGLV